MCPGGVGFAQFVELPLERQMKAAAELGSGLPGECDGYHVFDVINTRSDAGGHAFSEHLRLARPGTCLEQQICVQVGPHELA
jgi:hypothetical protein